MRDIKHLYGHIEKEILETQASVAKAKIQATNDLLDQLLKAPKEVRDWDRIHDVVEARQFNERFLEEVEND